MVTVDVAFSSSEDGEASIVHARAASAVPAIASTSASPRPSPPARRRARIDRPSGNAAAAASTARSGAGSSARKGRVGAVSMPLTKAGDEDSSSCAGRILEPRQCLVHRAPSVRAGRRHGRERVADGQDPRDEGMSSPARPSR